MASDWYWREDRGVSDLCFFREVAIDEELEEDARELCELLGPELDFEELKKAYDVYTKVFEAHEARERKKRERAGRRKRKRETKAPAVGDIWWYETEDNEGAGVVVSSCGITNPLTKLVMQRVMVDRDGWRRRRWCKHVEGSEETVVRSCEPKPKDGDWSPDLIEVKREELGELIARQEKRH